MSGFVFWGSKMVIIEEDILVRGERERGLVSVNVDISSGVRDEGINRWVIRGIFRAEVRGC